MSAPPTEVGEKTETILNIAVSQGSARQQAANHIYPDRKCSAAAFVKLV